METKLRQDEKTEAEAAHDNEQPISAPAKANEDKNRAKPRSIREMVIDNNQRFAATMKSLGE
jgi:hypothetical protein